MRIGACRPGECASWESGPRPLTFAVGCAMIQASREKQMLVSDTFNLYQTDSELLADTCRQWTQTYNEMICVAEVFELGERKVAYERELAKFKCYDC